MIELRNVGKSYENKNILTNINLSVEKDSIVGLVGENGAGKSTIMKIITGLIKNYSGEKIVNYGARIGLLIDGPSFYSDYDAKTNLRLLGAYNNITSKDIEQIYNKFKLNEFGKKKYSKYSLGMKQRLGIAFAFLGNPNVLVLDEPFNGVDPKMTIEIIDVLMAWKKETKGSIIISSHILSQLDKLCDKVVFVAKGSIAKIIDVNESNMNNSIYKIKLAHKDENLHHYLISNNIKILDCSEMKNYKIEIDVKSKFEIIKEISRKFDIEEIYKERQTIESMFRKVEEMENASN